MKPGDWDAAHLQDMLEVALEARELVADIQAKAFLKDRVRRRALERMLELVGEAARRITLVGQAEHPEIRWRRIIGQRNILALEYGRIDPRLLYQTAREDMPSLIAALERIVPRP
jgi:uncharacterized protein with HEPN domain